MEKEDSEKKVDDSANKEEAEDSSKSVEDKESFNKETSEKDSGEKDSSKGKEPEDPKKKEEERLQNRQLRNFLIVLGVILILTVVLLYSYNQPEEVEYKNLEFASYTDQGGITFYRTGLPRFNSNGEPAGTELFYLRTHPDDLKNVSFDGEIEFQEKLMISSQENRTFSCDGEGVLSTGNINNLYSFLGLEVNASDSPATCDPDDNTTNLKYVEGDKPELRQTGPACYEAVVSDCQVLLPGEKFVAETLVKVRENIQTRLADPSSD